MPTKNQHYLRCPPEYSTPPLNNEERKKKKGKQANETKERNTNRNNKNIIEISDLAAKGGGCVLYSTSTTRQAKRWPG